MERKHWVMLAMGVSLLVVTVTVLAVTLPAKADPATLSCPASFTAPPLVLVSLDGFKPEYLERGITPYLSALKEEGVSAPYMKPSYPSLTFPNHYTIVTGLYPESHGIIANKFYDPDFGATFSMGSAEALKGRWWGGEPIWNTLTKQGKKSATFYWVGSEADIEGLHPTYWLPYSDDTSFSQRVEQALAWLSLPAEDRPDWVSVYYNEPDHTGHGEGPDSNQEDALIMYVDLMIGRLLSGLHDLGLGSCANVVILSDHGMAQAGKDKIVYLKDYLPDVYDQAFTYTGAFGRINLKTDDEELEINMLQNLTCQREELRAYDYRDLPTRFHFSNNPRIEDIVLDLDPGYISSITSDFYLEGQHGYDNYYPEMNALFIARGPGFRSGIEVEPFQNIELYNLMCHLTGVDPAPNNGTQGSLYHLLSNPPLPPTLPQEDKPPSSPFPSPEDIVGRLSISGCPGDLDSVEPWVETLNLTPSEEAAALSSHVPWGVPHSGALPASLSLLPHQHYVTAYSEALKMPLWTSVSITKTLSATSSEWSSDVRLTADTTATCISYGDLEPRNVTMGPLLPAAFLPDPDLSRLPYMVSNAVPMSPYLAGRWQQLLEDLVPTWLDLYGSLNLVLGPVFDLDADSHVDDFTHFGPPPQVPSDMFAVVTRCGSPGSIQTCPPQDLDAAAFILPQLPLAHNCLNASRHAQMFSAKVRDVEMATGLTFYPDLTFEDRTRLQLRIHSDVWPSE